MMWRETSKVWHGLLHAQQLNSNLILTEEQMQICEGVQRPFPSHPNQTEQTDVLFPLYILLYILKNVSKKLKEMITKEVFLNFWLILKRPSWFLQPPAHQKPAKPYCSRVNYSSMVISRAVKLNMLFITLTANSIFLLLPQDTKVYFAPKACCFTAKLPPCCSAHHSPSCQSVNIIFCIYLDGEFGNSEVTWSSPVCFNHTWLWMWLALERWRAEVFSFFLFMFLIKNPLFKRDICSNLHPHTSINLYLQGAAARRGEGKFNRQWCQRRLKHKTDQ